MTLQNPLQPVDNQCKKTIDDLCTNFSADAVSKMYPIYIEERDIAIRKKEVLHKVSFSYLCLNNTEKYVKLMLEAGREAEFMMYMRYNQ